MRTGTRWNNVGLPSEGNDHPDPITDLVGIHPIEAGIGAAFAGIFLALALGAVAGPTFAVLGAIVGVLAGTCIGDGVGEIIAPRLGAPADIALARSHRASMGGTESEYDKDDFDALGSDVWPAWYDPVALSRSEQRQPKLGAGVS